MVQVINTAYIAVKVSYWLNSTLFEFVIFENYG